MKVELVHCTQNAEARETETWLPVPGWEDLYEVSDLGRVRGLDRVTYKRNGFPLRVRGQVLKPRPQKSGHLLVWLCQNGKAKAVNVHRLVALAFIGPCPSGKECCHNNGNPADNRAFNLRWDTRAENIRQSYVDGRPVAFPRLKGLQHPSSRLTAELVCQIRESKLSCAKAAYVFGVSPMTISRCRRMLTYQEIG